ncbi:NADPH-dependent glutamate synthase [bacterium]|jgi:glutamate synthase (NADPH/NADH) small chain|nr:NADPH-dependent glutamate synthase [bacterium]
MNKRLTKNPMPSQEAEKRKKNFEEVALGYTKEMAIDESMRCLDCKNPRCVEGCPVAVNIPSFINKIKQGDFVEAANIIKENNSLPAICGRVCPQESQCEAKCVRGLKGEAVAIGYLERFVADYTLNREDKVIKEKSNGKKVAIVGSGPSGLTCAGELAKRGYDVTIFEALHTAGGVLVYGIPEFRLPKVLVEAEIAKIRALGVKIITNVVVGRSISIDELLKEGFQAVYVGTGAGLPKWQGVPGEDSLGVYSANEFLTRINLMKAYKFPEYDTPIRVGKRVAVLGGGNVAMDAARSALRLGVEEVYVIYRRGRKEMPARVEEVEHALEEGVQFELLTNTVEILANKEGRVTGIKVVKMQLGEVDASGRPSPVPILGSEHIIPVDTVVVAIGNNPNPLIAQTTEGLKSEKWGGIIVDEKGMTSREGVYAGGDVVSGAATIILAMGAGKKAAKAIDESLRKKARV